MGRILEKLRHVGRGTRSLDEGNPYNASTWGVGIFHTLLISLKDVEAVSRLKPKLNFITSPTSHP